MYEMGGIGEFSDLRDVPRGTVWGRGGCDRSALSRPFRAFSWVGVAPGLRPRGAGALPWAWLSRPFRTLAPARVDESWLDHRLMTPGHPVPARGCEVCRFDAAGGLYSRLRGDR
jgi:hypothetical protein